MDTDSLLAQAARRGKNISNYTHIGADYTPTELEFMEALDRYKRKYCRPYPTCQEVLAVLQTLDYIKRGDISMATPQAPIRNIITVDGKKYVAVMFLVHYKDKDGSPSLCKMIKNYKNAKLEVGEEFMIGYVPVEKAEA